MGPGLERAGWRAEGPSAGMTAGEGSEGSSGVRTEAGPRACDIRTHAPCEEITRNLHSPTATRQLGDERAPHGAELGVAVCGPK